MLTVQLSSLLAGNATLTLAVIAGLTLGLGLPIFLFGLTILALSLVDVTAQQLGVGTE